MDYLDKAITSVEENLKDALKELEEIQDKEHKEKMENVCIKLREIVAELKAIK